MFRYFGATNVRIINGGLKKWILEGREIVHNVPYREGEFLDEVGDYSYTTND